VETKLAIQYKVMNEVFLAEPVFLSQWPDAILAGDFYKISN